MSREEVTQQILEAKSLTQGRAWQRPDVRGHRSGHNTQRGHRLVGLQPLRENEGLRNTLSFLEGSRVPRFL